MLTVTPFITRKSHTNDFWNEVDRMFEGAAKAPMMAAPTDIFESENEFSLSLDLPGLSKNDIKVEVHERTLTISGERKRAEVSDTKKAKQFEKPYGQFKRSFLLPTTVSTENIGARFENGVLELSLPKVPAAQARQIEIQTAAN